MNAEQLLYNIKNNLNLGNLEQIKEDFTTYRKARCLRPNRVKIFNSVKGIFEVKELPCGCCKHCRSIRQAEWVSRAYAHLEDFKYCYFVTLTYRSFSKSDLSNPINSFTLEYLNDALYHYDNLNFNEKYEYSPTVLVKKHFQNFMKRLRKSTGINGITYMMCGEYGHTYARPHAHYILFSNEPISKVSIMRAWSVHFTKDKNGVLSRNPRGSRHYYRVIGNIDYHQLVENGTITNQNITIDGSLHNANSCFAYVCKYIGKNEANYNRLWLAYYSLYSYKPNTETYNTYCKGIDGDISYTQHIVESKPIINLNPNLYAKNLQLDITYPHEFYRIHKQFHEVSRGCPIGSLFFKNHLQEFKNGNIHGSSLQTQGYVTPTYFRRKTAEVLYSLRMLKTSEKSVSPNKGNLPFILDLLQRNCFSADSFFSYTDVSQFTSVRDEITKNSVFIDLVSGERFIAMKDCFGICWIDVYKYSRSLRDYIKLRDMSVSEFCEFWFGKLRLYIRKMRDEQDKNEQIEITYRKAEELFHQLLDTTAEPDLDSNNSSSFRMDSLKRFYFDVLERIHCETIADNSIYHLKHNRIWNETLKNLPL